MSAWRTVDQIERIRQKLREVPRMRNRRHVYGEDAHRFVVRPPIAERDLLDFERRNGVRLPSSYRRYLLEIADGGAGPGNEIYPLGHRIGRVVGLDRPFALDLGRGPDLDDRTWRGALMDAYDAEVPPDHDGNEDTNYPFLGTLPVSNQGCSAEDVLVVTGPARGRLVMVDHDLNGPPRFYPEESFLDWYEAWLDGIIARCATDEELLDQALTHELSGSRRAAWWDLGRRPDLAAPLVDVIAGAAVDGDRDLRERTEAVRVLAGHADLSWPLGSMMRPLLSDPDESVRAALVEALGEQPEWGPRHPAVAEFAVDESWNVHWALLQSLRRRTRRTEDAVAAGIEALRAELAR